MNNRYFRDKVIIITGARQGIGKALSLLLAEAGARLSINSRNAEKLAELKNKLFLNGCDVIEIPGDISEEEVCRNIVKKTIERF